MKRGDSHQTGKQSSFLMHANMLISNHRGHYLRAFVFRRPGPGDGKCAAAFSATNCHTSRQQGAFQYH